MSRDKQIRRREAIYTPSMYRPSNRFTIVHPNWKPVSTEYCHNPKAKKAAA